MQKNTVRFLACTIVASTLVLTPGFFGSPLLFSNDGVAVALTIAEKAAAKAAEKAAAKAAKKDAAKAAKAGKRSAITAKKAAMKAEKAANGSLGFSAAPDSGGGGGSGKVHVVPVEEKGVQGDRLKDEDELSKIDDRQPAIDRDRITYDRRKVCKGQEIEIMPKMEVSVTMEKCM